ncbi:hypothetical protein [Parvibaculum sp.]|uniref:hypothetical protein n=1 Tax=Parvibaculum sp. TaxID=2024848 RepID=UPI00391A83C5
MTTRLDVVSTITEAYGGAWRNLGDMVRLIWFPVALYLVFSIARVFVDVETQFFLALVLEIASLFLWPVIAVTWHRFILLGDEPTGPIHFSFGRREAIFLLVSIFLILLFIPGAALSLAAAQLQETPSGALLALFGLFLVAIAVYFFVRLTLLLPAVAIGDPVDPRLVLERTRGNFWRLLAVMFAVAVPILLLSSLAGSLMAGGGAMQIAAVAIAAFVYVFFAVVNIAVLSIAYRELVGPPGSVPRETEPHIDPTF